MLFIGCTGGFARLRGVVGMLALAGLAGLAGCSTTEESFHSAGLGRIVEGQTTLAQASDDLGAQPVDRWQQGDTLLARWAYRGTVATDAVYLRQEVWLRFGPDGRFMRTERTVNVPALYHTRKADPSALDTRGENPGTTLAAPLLPVGTQVIPAATYPVGPAGR
ncbi:hypothetical protein CDEF62S_03927 [Castellaniella defragrans]